VQIPEVAHASQPGRLYVDRTQQPSSEPGHGLDWLPVESPVIPSEIRVCGLCAQIDTLDQMREPVVRNVIR
jgi:hypothetical protein